MNFFYDFLIKSAWIVGSLFLSALLTLAIVAICKSASASGKVDYCTVLYRSSEPYPYWELEGHRTWRSDVSIAKFRTFEEAEQAKEKCLSAP